MRIDRRYVRAAVLCIFTAVLLAGVYASLYHVPDHDWEIKIIYGEFHANLDGGTSQLFYADKDDAFDEERSLMQNVWEMDQCVTFALPELSLARTKLRFDPFMNQDIFSIYVVEVRHSGTLIVTIGGDEFRGYVEEMEHCVYDEVNRVYIPQTEDPILYLGPGLNQRIMTVWRNGYITYQRECGLILGMITALYLAVWMLWTVAKKTGSPRAARPGWRSLVAADIVLCLGTALLYAVFFMIRNFGNVRLEELFFLMNTTLDGTNLSSFYPLFAGVAGILAAVSALIFLGGFWLKRERRDYGYSAWMAVMGLTLIVSAVWIGVDYFDVSSYYAYIHDKSSFYEEHFVDAKETSIVFPEEKRNLIYIYLESMEMTFADKTVGGAMEENYMPELTELALENINFSGPNVMNGAHTVSGTTFTSGALVAQTAGVPINTSIISNETVNAGIRDGELLPGVWTLENILAQEGYRQVFMIGSDANFGTRRQYFEGHGNVEVSDYYTAREEGRIPEDYYVWWGYEDEKLFDFAKEELMLLAEGDEPFHFSMLTVDTHFTGGYVCELCENMYDDQYSNVIACSSRQVAEFVSWIAQQDFYENTTIILSGDHLTMDTEYIDRMLYGTNYDRRTYVSIINPAEGCTDSDVAREYTTLDLYPTTLAALGAEIEGDRLGLGVNLFSGIPTLYEEYGGTYLDAELLKRSDLYAQKLVYDEEYLAEDEQDAGV